jgi:H+/gluconate symporter-like permease
MDQVLNFLTENKIAVLMALLAVCAIVYFTYFYKKDEHDSTCKNGVCSINPNDVHLTSTHTA